MHEVESGVVVGREELEEEEEAEREETDDLCLCWRQRVEMSLLYRSSHLARSLLIESALSKSEGEVNV